MHVLQVDFEPRGMAPGAYEARCEEIAPAFAALPGLLAKAWVVEPGTGRAGGIYSWTDRAACDAYLDGPVFAAIRADPSLADVRWRRFDVLEGPTAVTGGLAAAGAAG